MKMKKMLAVLAAISMLASMGISAAAEDEAVTTTVTTAEEAVTTTATETTATTEATTAAETTTVTEETTAETTTSSETETTVATEENETLKYTVTVIDSADFTLDGFLFQVDLVSSDLGYTLDVSKIEDGALIKTNLSSVLLVFDNTLTSASSRFSVSGDVLTIHEYEGDVSYQYVNGQFVKVGETETISIVDEKTETIIEQGKEYVVKFVLYTKPSDSYYISVYVDGKLSNLADIPVGRYADSSLEKSVNGYAGISKGSESEITITDWSDTATDPNPTTTSFHYRYDPDKGEFVDSYSANTPTDPEKTFTVEIPTSYVTAVCGITGEPITESNYKNSMVVSVTDITGCTNGTASIVSNGSFVAGFTVKDAKPGTITITGTTGTFSSNDGDPSINTSHGQCGAAGNPDTFTVNVTIDENGNITGTSPVTPDAPVQPTVLEIYENDSLTVTGTLSYEWDEAYMSFKHAILTLDTPITVKYMDGEWIDKAGTTQTIDSVQIALDDELPEGTRLKVTGNVMYGHTIHHLRDIVLLDCTYEVLDSDGKTDSGSTTSNKPSNNNTAGTPKTGDVATLPAVALGLTMTAAGVVAVLYKKRK